jgi:hypothetical protein
LNDFNKRKERERERKQYGGRNSGDKQEYEEDEEGLAAESKF